MMPLLIGISPVLAYVGMGIVVIAIVNTIAVGVLPPPSSTIHPPTMSATAMPTWLKLSATTLLVALYPGGNHISLRRGGVHWKNGWDSPTSMVPRAIAG
jgi:hypothetical protein